VHPDDERYQDLVGKSVQLPLTDRLIPIIADEHADPEQGTGAVKITPAHDFNDFEVGKRHNLPMINIFDINACLNEETPGRFQGLDRFEARREILRELDEGDFLVEVTDHNHVMPYGDRSGVIIEPFLTDQWFCDAQTLAKPAIEAVEKGKTVFVPKQWENTFFEWMRNIQPWCISRQLWWGHRIPAWYGPEGSVFVEESEEEAYAAAREHYGEEVELEQDEDVLDTWFSSGLWPFSTIGWPDRTKELEKYYPGDVLITGFDIIFFWVARMMMMGIHFMGEVPFRTVYMHALVRDARGQKMSKSKGNVIDPLELIDNYGADALRFTLIAMAAQGRDIKLSEDRVEGYRNFATKLWNASRYCEMNGCDYDPQFKPETVTYIPNKWIVSEVVKILEKIDNALENFRFNDAAAAIYQFTWGTFCDWYLEFTKPILSERADDDELVTEVRNTTAWTLEQILSLLNPFMPYITEELHRELGYRRRGITLLSQDWPEYGSEFIENDAIEEMDWLCRLITEVRSVRSDMNVPASAKIKLLVSGASDKTRSRIETYDEIIRRMARIENISIGEDVPKGSLQTVLDEATLIMPVADIIDLDKESERLRKEICRLEVDLEKIERKLGNEDFVSKAPAEVVEEQKKRREEAKSTITKLASALSQLEAA
jgi:valyl-tRNA synthetase